MTATELRLMETVLETASTACEPKPAKYLCAKGDSNPHTVKY